MPTDDMYLFTHVFVSVGRPTYYTELNEPLSAALHSSRHLNAQQLSCPLHMYIFTLLNIALATCTDDINSQQQNTVTR
jgi:hypothetical protein